MITKDSKGAALVYADFTGTCEGCYHITTEPGAKDGGVLYRCFALGPCRGYVVSDRKGRILPYIPAWCPILRREQGESEENQ